MLKIKKILSVFIMLIILSTNTYAKISYREIGPAKKIFDGEALIMLKSSTASQMMAYVIITKNKKLIVVDGGLKEDAKHLKEVIKDNGGVVDAWLLTHPHSDHVGALTSILNEENSGIEIKSIHYHLLDFDWYQRNEAYRADTVKELMEALEKVSREKLYSSVKYGDKFLVDDVVINIMNAPYLFTHNSINNSSIAYRLDMGSRKVMFLGDMGEEAGKRLLEDVPRFELKADVVQMAHHGQYGVSKEVYQAISPIVAMWNAPAWLYHNYSGKYLTLEVREWMQEIGVRRNLTIENGDQVLK